MSTKTTTIERVWDGATCVRCGRNSHTKDTCYAKTDRLGNNIQPMIVKTEVVETEKSFWSKIKNEFVNPDSDMRSGRFLRR